MSNPEMRREVFLNDFSFSGWFENGRDSYHDREKVEIESRIVPICAHNAKWIYFMFKVNFLVNVGYLEVLELPSGLVILLDPLIHLVRLFLHNKTLSIKFSHFVWRRLAILSVNPRHSVFAVFAGDSVSSSSTWHTCNRPLTFLNIFNYI